MKGGPDVVEDCVECGKLWRIKVLREKAPSGLLKYSRLCCPYIGLISLWTLSTFTEQVKDKKLFRGFKSC